MRNKTTDKHQRILDAAVKVFAEKGFFQSKVSEIAREAGVADGTVYLYFKNKDDLLISIFQVKMEDIISRFRTLIEEKGNALSRLKCLIRLHFEEFQANPELAAVFQVELRQSSRFMLEYKKSELKNYLDLIGEIIEQGQKEGVFRGDVQVSLAKSLIFGSLDELVSTWVLSGRRYRLESLVEPLADLFTRGLRLDSNLPPKDDSRGLNQEQGD